MTPPEPELPSSRQLLRATAAAMIAAAIVLVAAVLPAEYGLDPVGVGKRLGIFRPRADATPQAAAPLSGVPSGGALFKSSTSFNRGEMDVVLAPGQGAEIKLEMSQGQRVVFSWVAHGGSVEVDMHGEAQGAPEGEFTSYWKETSQASGHGAFEAPVTGRHGWFWQNLGAAPVTVTVKVSGFYQKMFQL